ncbi:MAG TPA: AAA family ATPase [Anaerolineales bacterium]|nr:AAA family ATPase [Anaerolineales bacterium]
MALLARRLPWRRTPAKPRAHKPRRALVDRFHYWLTGVIAFFLALIIQTWRNRTARAVILYFAAISAAVIYFFSFETYTSILGTASNFVFGFGFILIQFVGLFWFLSRTRVIETVPGDKGAISFDDYYGSKHLVKLMREWTKLLTVDKSKLDAMGGRSLSGILLIGPPGTGKTMLAQCLSTESHAAFIGMSGSDFQSMFFGIGVLKVRSMFSKARERAKEYGACILFIDEVDSIASSRGGVVGDPNQPVMGGMGGGLFGGMSGGLGVLSRLLVEMDGITEVPLRDRIQNRMLAWLGVKTIDPGVVLVMGSTNRPDVIDPAILRPGRFDRKIEVTLPDRGDRRALFNGYLKKIKHDGKINVDYLVRITPGVSQAFIASAVTKDSARLAIFDGRKAIRQGDIEMALQEITVGIPQPVGELEPRQREVLSYHEAGHAVAVYHYMRDDANIGWASIVRRGGAMGYVQHVETEDRYIIPLARLKKGIMVSLCGHEAVKLVYSEPWTGAASDLNNVRRMIAVLIAHLEFGALPRDFDILKAIEQKQIDRYMEDSMAKARTFLTAHRAELDAVAAALRERDELQGSEVIEIIESVHAKAA